MDHTLSCVCAQVLEDAALEHRKILRVKPESLVL